MKAVQGMPVLATLLLVSLLLNAFTLLADSKVRQRTPAMAECAGILSQANRLARYDSAQEAVSTPPAGEPTRLGAALSRQQAGLRRCGARVFCDRNAPFFPAAERQARGSLQVAPGLPPARE
jgi:hypothetical protein